MARQRSLIRHSIFDHLETQSSVDATRVGIEGVSRYGKAALVAMAFDARFAVVLVGSSGEGGAKLHRRNFGEADAVFGSMNPGDLPIDAHELIALCAPRPVFISYGVPEKGDALWLDQQGSFKAAVAAQPLFRLLGAKDLGRSDDYLAEKMPPVNVGLLDGALAVVLFRRAPSCRAEGAAERLAPERCRGASFEDDARRDAVSSSSVTH